MPRDEIAGPEELGPSFLDMCNPRDRGAWWAAVYGVAQSWTQLMRLSSSSSSSRRQTLVGKVMSLLLNMLSRLVPLAASKESHIHTPKIKLKYVIYAAKSLQSCPTLCDPIDGSPPGSPVPGILPREEYWSGVPLPSPFDTLWTYKSK